MIECQRGLILQQWGHHQYSLVVRIEEQTGSIEIGKWADTIVLNQDRLEIPLTDIFGTVF